MYSLSKEIEEKIVKDCFDDVCRNAQKEEAGAFKGFVNTIKKAKIFLDVENGVAVVNKKQDLDINYNYKFTDSKTRIQIIEKVENPYVFEIVLNGKKITLECEQYKYKCLD